MYDETPDQGAVTSVSSLIERSWGSTCRNMCPPRSGDGTGRGRSRDRGGERTALDTARRSAPAPTLRPHATLSSSFGLRLHRRHARLHLRARGGPMARGVALVLQPRHAARWHRAAEIGGLDLGVARGHEAGAKDVEQLGPLAGQLREADVLAAEVLRGLRTPSVRGALRHPVGRPEERESRSPQACSSRRRLETSSSARVLGEDSISSRSPASSSPMFLMSSQTMGSAVDMMTRRKMPKIFKSIAGGLRHHAARSKKAHESNEGCTETSGEKQQATGGRRARRMPSDAAP